MGLLPGRKILVTASSRGIGFGIAKVLLREGAEVVINGRTRERLEGAVRELRSLGRANYVVADLSVEGEARRLVKEAVNIMGGLTDLVYVPPPPKGGKFSELSEGDWNVGINQLIKGAITTVRESLDYVIRAKGCFIFIGSVAIREPIVTIALSNVLRIALAGLTKQLAKELGPLGVRTNLVLPGYIMTDRLRNLARKWARERGVDEAEIIDELREKVPLRKIGIPEDIGELVAFLLSSKASYINGVAIPVDGGLLNHVF